MARIARQLLFRLPLIGAVALSALLLRLSAAAPPPPSRVGVAAMLSDSVGGPVDADEFVWERSEGSLRDALWGRNLLFLGSTAEGAPRDVFRAKVRVSREGKPIGVRSVRNLTATPLGDEDLLAARSHYVAFVTHAFGVVQGLTILDLDGAGLTGLSWSSRTLVQLDNWLQVGSTDGLKRTEVVFHKPPRVAQIELRDESLIMALGDPPAAAALDLQTTALNTGRNNAHQALAWTSPPRIKPLSHFIIDALRELIGTEPADTFKAVLFRARSKLVRFAGRYQQRAAAAVDQPAGINSDPGWPPTAIPPRFRHALEGEGQWRRPPVDWLPAAKGTIGKAEPYLVETVIRPDPALPFAQVRLVAIDTRQLDLRIEAGFDEPRPLTGPRGRGTIPKAARPQLVAAFNGAFQTRHGSYGMVVDRRVLLPPTPHASTVAVDVQGRAHFGTWGESEAVPEQFVSLRQNLDPLIEGGVINPRGRKQWGFPLEGASYLTERSALCRTTGGFLVYGWGIELTAETLAKGLAQAGCSDAMHLDMNPGHVGFAYYNTSDDRPKAQLVAPEMSIPPKRFIKAAPKDFFYLVLRDATPTAGDLTWKPDGGAQPPPAWWPAVHRSEVKRLGAEISLLAVAADRFAWQIRPGEREKAGRTAEGALTPAEHAHAMVAVGLGVGFRRGNRRGLVLDGVHSLPIRPDLGVLSTNLDGMLGLARSVEEMAPPGDATELVLLAENGRLRSEARKLGIRRTRAAACMLPNRTVLIALAAFDSGEANAATLVELGCERVVELNRGKQIQAFVHRAGSAAAPQAQYTDTTLYGMAKKAGGEALLLTP